MRPLLKNNGKNNGDALPYPEEEWEFECPQRFEGAEIHEDYIDHLDWRTNTTNPAGIVAVVAVKNQASCGSCYVFSANSAMESALCLKGIHDCETFGGLSEQQPLDCATYDVQEGEDRTWYLSNGCYGGWQSNIYQYVYRAGGITCTHKSPYMSGDRDAFPDSKFNVGQCPYTWETQYDWIQETSHGYVDKNICGTTNKGGSKDPIAMKQALFSKGPLAIGMFVGDNFRDVVEGIYTPEDDNEGDCPGIEETGINHAMNAVGYGVDETTEQEYWIIRNSWGETFAQGGYVKVARGVNACGVEGNISYPDMNGEPEEEDEHM